MAELDPEEARAIVDPALRVMIGAVHRYGGSIVQSTGDGIFALFGAPIAHEDHPQRALYAAMRRQLVVRPWAACRPAWRDLATPANGATLYHDERWLSLLEQVYGFKIVVAGIHSRSGLVAACLLARTKNPFKACFVGLPFSDTCPPLPAGSALMPLLSEALTAAPMPRDLVGGRQRQNDRRGLDAAVLRQPALQVERAS